MKYNFDELIDRTGTSCKKYDGMMEAKGRDDLMPFWIADMDFKSCDAIVNALKKRLEHPVFGYHKIPDDYYPTIAEWVKFLHGWDIDYKDIRYVPGIVKGICFAIENFIRPGEKIAIQSPVYHEFKMIVEQHHIECVDNPLVPVEVDGTISGYKMNFSHLENILDEDKSIKMLIMSNPQNPVGVSWSREDLMKVAEITSKRGVIVISDEIYAEMTLPGSPEHIPYASVSDAAASNAITFMAPSKTFNISGIVSSYCIIVNEELREKFFYYLDTDEIEHPTIFATTATLAAYKEGNEWREQMLEYVQSNVDYVCDYLNRNIPQVRVLRPQFGFLLWLDCRGLGLSQKDLISLFEDKAHLALNDGECYGPGGVGFMRFNIGCPRETLRIALDRFAESVRTL